MCAAEDACAAHADAAHRPVVLGGHSAGGGLAAEYALRGSYHVDALARAAPPADGLGPWLVG